MKTINGKFITGCLLVIFFLSVFSVANAQEGWVVPEKYKTMKNPVKSDNASTTLGKSLYVKNCASCHGKAGLGDGPKSKTLTATMDDLSGAKYQGQTDGEQFYKTKFGKGEMPKYDKKVPDEDIWAIVNYMRTLKK